MFGRVLTALERFFAPVRVYTLLAAAVLILAGIAVYANSFQAPFVMDGNVGIVDNESIRQIRPWNFTLGNNRPLGFLTFALNYAVAEMFTRDHDGYDVWGYHAVNVAIHVAAALVLFGIVRRTLSRGRLAECFSGRAGLLAFAVALLWLVHPLQTESVTFVYQRLEALMGLFYLLTLYCFVRSLDAGRPRWLWPAGSVASCVLGMATKEVMFTAPFAVLWYDRVFAASTWSELLRKRWGFYLGLAGTWVVLAALMFGSRDKYSEGGIGTENAAGITPWQYARSQPGVILHYLRLSFWPRGQCLDYNWPVADAAAVIFWTSAALGALLGVTIFLMWKRPAWGFVAGCFFLILGPTSSFVPIVDLAFEHRMYLSLASVVVIVVLLLDLLCRNGLPELLDFDRKRRLHAGILAGVLLPGAVALGYQTKLRNDDYRSATSIMEEDLRTSPRNPRPHRSLVLAYIMEAHRVDRSSAANSRLKNELLRKAIDEADAAIALTPKSAENLNAMVYNNRGHAYAGLGDKQAALRSFSQAIELEPTAMYCTNRAKLRSQLELVDAAIEDARRAIDLDPKYVDAYESLAALWQTKGRLDLAVGALSKAIELEPNRDSFYASRGDLYQASGRGALAVADFTAAIKLNPDNSACYASRGQSHFFLHHYKEAVQDYSQAIKLAPDKYMIYNNRALAYHFLGRDELAWADIERCRKLGGEPMPEALEILGSPLSPR